jgi:AcrR family transcriptional regulator
MEDPKTTPPKRAYRSAVRTQQAAATRAQILDAAREAFGARGYPGTTVDDVAARARVSVATIYWTFGSKRRLLRAVLEGIGRDADIGPQISRIAQAGDACEQMLLIARLAASLWAAAATVLRGVERARGLDPSFDAWFQTIDDERRDGQRPVIAELHRRGLIREGLTVDAATDLLFVLSGPGLYSALVADRGWPSTAYESWLTTMLRQTLLVEGGNCPDGGSDR